MNIASGWTRSDKESIWLFHRSTLVLSGNTCYFQHHVEVWDVRHYVYVPSVFGSQGKS
jgi:hypothetical protein